MPRHIETRLLPYTPEQMFDLVADVARYPEFLPWIVATRVRANSGSEMLADVVVGFKGLRETFTSRVFKHRAESIRTEYLDGPLKYLVSEWRFARDDEGGCRLDFTVDFAFRSRVFEAIAGQVFGTALRRMTGAFQERAARLYDADGDEGISRSSAHTAA